tara:strand:- start:607 stop:777 length:171 start_codon:yes stop_codon:yes gene_type:complete
VKIGDLVSYRGRYGIILNEHYIKDRDTRWWVVVMSDNHVMMAAPEKHMEVINENRK